ncbi:acyltransferase domain-containing protein [Devosia nitrariae]|uniref:DUF5596 domain-containing protein n=1 Tax=Devosia nitrariae TaxID=2071872 RepID=A0ABQ5WAI7_9HYPH|nr:acyltransferase domain-containing protein [Devosia nitrariae]GLQ57081.1 hypothetical protein GCM10010862_43400 [Devosia nitrariae]
MSALDAEIVGERLGLTAGLLEWLRARPLPAGSPSPVLPDDETVCSYLAALAVEVEAWSEILTTRPDPASSPELWWALERVYHDLVSNLGNGAAFAGWPNLPVDGTAPVRHLYIWTFLAAVPDVRQYHAGHGIPDEISWATLRSLGQAVTDSRASGLLFALWVQPLAFRGVHYRIGRLAYDLGGTKVPHLDGADLAVHIGAGQPLEPHDCDQSFAQAAAFFRRHFPRRPVRRFTCHSWLLDDQLADYLPEGSNILQFQRRFQLLPLDEEREERADNVILEYVFERMHTDPLIPDEVLEDLPQTTSLQRAFVTHLRSGRHWYSRTGWFPASAIR